MADYEGRAVVLAGGEEYGCDAVLIIRHGRPVSAGAFGGANRDSVPGLPEGWGGYLMPDDEEAMTWAIHDADGEVRLRIGTRESTFTVDSQSSHAPGRIVINGNNPPPFD